MTHQPRSAREPWPDDAIEQLTALREAIGNQPGSAEKISRRFQGVTRVAVEKHIETLEVLGVVTRDGGGRWTARAGHSAELRT